MLPTAPDTRVGEPRTMGQGRTPIGRFFRTPEWGLVAGIVAVLALIYLVDTKHAFFQGYSIQTLLHRVALFGVLAVGAAVVIISGGIDLSTGAVVAVSSVVSATMWPEWPRPAGASGAGPPAAAIVAAVIGLTLLMGLAVGLFHALLINQIRLPPFIATLATMAGLRSVATVLSRNKTITVPYDS